MEGGYSINDNDRGATKDNNSSTTVGKHSAVLDLFGRFLHTPIVTRRMLQPLQTLSVRR
jgi:hypothetical protein